MIFVKNFPPEKSKGNECRTDFVCLIGRNIKMAKFIRLSDDAVFVFLRVRRFSGARFCSAAFFHTRAYVHVGICAPAHTCATHAHLLWAREERNFSCRRFMILLRSFFIRQAPKKQNCGIFGGKQCGTIQNSGKKREIRLETAEKRLFAAMKGRYLSERTVKRRKTAKKREKRKKRKKN